MSAERGDTRTRTPGDGLTGRYQRRTARRRDIGRVGGGQMAATSSTHSAIADRELARPCHTTTAAAAHFVNVRAVD